MAIDQIKREVHSLNWFHTIDLGNGIITPGCDNSFEKLKRIHMPLDLTGRSVLDIGAWDGFFSFEAERRGAARTLAVDYHCWSGPGWGSQEGFNLAKRTLNSNIEALSLEVIDLDANKIGTFDLVLFLGVLYHMKRPQDALASVASVSKDLLIIETHVDFLGTKDPVVAFYPNSELSGDHTNWCGPNLSALEWMIRDVGFTQLKRVIVPLESTV